MEYYVKLPKAIKRTLEGYKNLIKKVEAEAIRCLDNGDLQGMIKHQYDVNLIQSAYDVLRGEYDPYYKRALYYRPILDTAIIEDSLGDALGIAKKMGFNNKDVCNALGLNGGNLCSYLKGKKPYSIENKHKIYNFVREILN